ncbi:MAG: bifunctional riboflavin kinase/FAD synthetase [Chloroflexi bacterium]|nr:bifunctional riboflavin kinase/FAD synthetase [Chloroflexota bacterium]
MLLIDNWEQAHLEQDTVATIGAFDGVHLGHQFLIRNLVARAKETGRLAMVVTFHPHPVAVLRPDLPIRYLTTPGEKAVLMEQLSLDILAILPFDAQMAQMSAAEFTGALVRHLRLRELWVGPDFALGRNREGDIATLRALGADLGFAVRAVEPFLLDGEVVSSTRIRALLAQGDVRGATRLLGRYPTVAGEVVPGARRGRALGYPTANLEVRQERAVPADGVYAVFAVLGTERYPGVANIGVRPSFDNGARTVETFILDFDQDIYGCDLVVEFVERLRPEQRFPNIADLVRQIGQDVEVARRILDDEARSRKNP